MTTAGQTKQVFYFSSKVGSWLVVCFEW